MTKLMDHRVRVTHMLIRRAFTALLREKPIQSISIKELCERAGINRGTFYAHYKDIYDLRDRIETDMFDSVRSAIEPMLGVGSTATQLDITTAVFEWMQENRDMCDVILSEYGDRDFLWKLLSMGEAACEQSYLRKYGRGSTQDIDWFYAYASWGCIGLLRKWIDEDMKTPAGELAARAERLITYGMQALKKEP